MLEDGFRAWESKLSRYWALKRRAFYESVFGVSEGNLLLLSTIRPRPGNIPPACGQALARFSAEDWRSIAEGGQLVSMMLPPRVSQSAMAA